MLAQQGSPLQGMQPPCMEWTAQWQQQTALAAPRRGLREGTAAESPSGDSDRVPPRGPDCDGRVLGVELFPSAEPVDPAEPVVSAAATAGITTTAAPMPRATASAPTRPT